MTTHLQRMRLGIGTTLLAAMLICHFCPNGRTSLVSITVLAYGFAICIHDA
jgi:hypothetical protein